MERLDKYEHNGEKVRLEELEAVKKEAEKLTGEKPISKFCLPAI